MTQVAVGLGSNIGDRFENMRQAARAILELPKCNGHRWSSLYWSEPVDCRDPHEFLNAAVSFHTALKPKELLKKLLQIEKEMGRERPYPNAPRPMDLDLLLYGQEIIDQEELTVPHPRMSLRQFVLKPLMELDPKGTHPKLQQSITALLHKCSKEDGTVIKSKRQWSVDLF